MLGDTEKILDILGELPPPPYPSSKGPLKI